MHEERKIIIRMNPDQLRKMADKMEKEYPKMAPGQSTFIDFLGYSNTLQVYLHVDQQWFADRKTAELSGGPFKPDNDVFCFSLKDIVIDTNIHGHVEIIHRPTLVRAACKKYLDSAKNERWALVELDKTLRSR